MIGKIVGKVSEHYNNTVIIEVQFNDCSIGYEITMKQTDVSSLQSNEIVTVYIKEIVKEDDDTLYGFLSFEDKCWFEELIKINGLGPKTALAILSSYSCETIMEAIILNNCDFFSSISGIGNKIANRIPIEMRKTVEKINEKVTYASGINDATNTRKNNEVKNDKISTNNKKSNNKKSVALFNDRNYDEHNHISHENNEKNIINNNKSSTTKRQGKTQNSKNNNSKNNIKNKNAIINDAIEALVALGFNRSNIYNDVFTLVKAKKTDDNDLSTENIIKAFLKKKG